MRGLKEESFFFTRRFLFGPKKEPTSKSSTAINSRDMNTLRVSGRCRILWRIDWWRNFWRARTSARAPVEYSTIWAKNEWFWRVSQQHEIWRAPRAEVRARQIFFRKSIFCWEISLQLFLFYHSSKIEFFRAIWSLVMIFEIWIFLNIFDIFKIFEKKWNFLMFYTKML